MGAAFPVYGRGTVPYDVAGRMEVSGNVRAVEIDGVQIERGDLIVADGDGIVIVPRAVEREAVRSALEKDAGEDRFRAAVAGGMLPSQAYCEFGVL